MPEEVLEQLKDMKMEMHIEYLNVNEAKDFEIPEEALNAQDINEMLKEFQQLETETEVVVETEEEL
jgi:hypothetical protein